MKFKVRCATVEDVDILVRHRLSMWGDIHPEFGVPLPGTEERTRRWISDKLSAGKLIGLIAAAQGGEVVGSGCIWIREQPPLPMTPLLEVPYIMSLFTEVGFRRMGVARLIMETAVSWCRSRGYDRVNLDASEAGKPLYESLGFRPGFSMRLIL